MGALRLPRVDPWPAAWAAGAAVLALLCGVLAGWSPPTAVGLAVAGAAAVAVAVRPYVVLLAIVLVLATFPLRELIPFALLFGGLPVVLARAPRLPGRRIAIPLALLLLLTLLSVPWLPSPDEGPLDPYLRLPLLGDAYARTPSIELWRWGTLAAVLTVFWIAAWTVRSRSRFDTLVTAILLSAVVPVTIALHQLATGNTYERVGTTLRSLRGPFPHPNYFAFYLVVVLTLAVAAVLESRSLTRRIALAALLPAGIVCLFLTYTRSAWIGFALCIVVMGALRHRRLLVVGLVGLALAGLIAPGATREAKVRFGDLTSRSEEKSRNSLSWRIDEWSAMLPYGAEKPLTGQGWESYSRLTVRKFGHANERYPTIVHPAMGVYSPLGFTAHNDYVKDFVEVGAPGLLLWLLVLLGLVGTAWRARRVPELAGMASAGVAIAIAFLMIAAADNLQSYTVVLTYEFALCGALAGLTYASSRRAPAGAVVAPAVAEEQPPPAPRAPAQPPEGQPEAQEEPQGQTEPGRTYGWTRARLRGLLRRRRRSL